MWDAGCCFGTDISHLSVFLIWFWVVLGLLCCGQTAIQWLENYTPEDLIIAELKGSSNSLWTISPPSRDNLIDMLRSQEEFSITVSWSIQRYPNIDSPLMMFDHIIPHTLQLCLKKKKLFYVILLNIFQFLFVIFYFIFFKQNLFRKKFQTLSNKTNVSQTLFSGCPNSS